MVASTSDPDRPQKKAVKLSTGKPQRAASKKSKKQKYDPAPMKAVAEQAQDLLAPVSQTDTPAAADPCAALNCKPSAPVRCAPLLGPALWYFTSLLHFLVM